MAQHKAAVKVLPGCTFKKFSKGSLPKQFGHLKTSRHHVSGLIDLGGGYGAVFLWKDGDVLERTAIYGWLTLTVGENLLPLLRLDWHPSHKGLHVSLNCEIPYDLTNRNVVGGKELQLKNAFPFDPKIEEHRTRFVNVFCARFGVTIKPEAGGELLDGH